MNPARAAVLPCITVLLLAAGPVRAGDADVQTLLQELKREVARLAERVTFLEGKLEHEQARRIAAEAAAAKGDAPGASAREPAAADAPAPAGAAAPSPAPVVVGDAKGTFRIPGTDTSLGFGGYVKLDAIYNSASAGVNQASDQIFFPGLVPLDDDGEEDQLAFSPRESRFWIKGLTPTALGDLGTYIEMDFYAFQSPGDQRVSNSWSPRLRHAYGTLGPFLAGQTWSTFVNTSAAPELVDFLAPAGRLFVRQPQLRWSGAFDTPGVMTGYQLALEQPESVLTLPDGTRVEADDDRVPDIVARFDVRPAWGTLSVSALGRQIRRDDGVTDSSRWGGAVSLAGRIRTTGADALYLQASYGNALGRYTSINAFNDGVVDASGRVHLFDVVAGLAAYQHWWSPAWRSTVAWGYASADNPAFTPGNVNEDVQSAHLNLLWSPYAQATFGLEYMFATRDTSGGDAGELHRILFSSKFNY
jgi:hypothetical protein